MDESSADAEAEKLFLKGAELERNNNYYEAIRYYRKAVQLVPDIDVQVFRKTKQKEFKYNSENKENYEVGEQSESDCDTEDEYDGSEPLIDRFRRILGKCGRLFTPKKPTKGLHLSDLPEEMIIYILRWVVSDELDLRCLEQCALVCRGFYLYARDPQIWKSACIRMWKNDRIQLKNYDSWRDMFLHHPKIGTNGCYIAETKYYRQGERSFQDQNYRPYHLVLYYRYLRFFADGSVLMVNTPEVPNQVVSQLKNKLSRSGTVIPGSYRIVDDMVFLHLKVERIRKHYVRNNVRTQFINLIYNLKLQIKKFKKWQTKLEWKEYKLSCPDDTNYEENFEIREHLFPPLRFSRVKSYTAESERPLP